MNVFIVVIAWTYEADTKMAGAACPSLCMLCSPERCSDPLATPADLDHRAQAARAGLDGLWTPIEHHVPVLQVQTELALGVPV